MSNLNEVFKIQCLERKRIEWNSNTGQFLIASATQSAGRWRLSTCKLGFCECFVLNSKPMQRLHTKGQRLRQQKSDSVNRMSQLLAKGCLAISDLDFKQDLFSRNCKGNPLMLCHSAPSRILNAHACALFTTQALIVTCTQTHASTYVFMHDSWAPTLTPLPIHPACPCGIHCTALAVLWSLWSPHHLLQSLHCSLLWSLHVHMLLTVILALLTAIATPFTAITMPVTVITALLHYDHYTLLWSLHVHCDHYAIHHDRCSTLSDHSTAAITALLHHHTVCPTLLLLTMCLVPICCHITLHSFGPMDAYLLYIYMLFLYIFKCASIDPLLFSLWILC